MNDEKTPEQQYHEANGSRLYESAREKKENMSETNETTETANNLTVDEATGFLVLGKDEVEARAAAVRFVVGKEAGEKLTNEDGYAYGVAVIVWDAAKRFYSAENKIPRPKHYADLPTCQVHECDCFAAQLESSEIEIAKLKDMLNFFGIEITPDGNPIFKPSTMTKFRKAQRDVEFAALKAENNSLDFTVDKLRRELAAG